MKKYARVNRRVEKHPVRDIKVTLWSIKALVDIPAHNVKAGDIGGSIDRQSYLSQSGDAWLGDSAYAVDKAAIVDDALVTDDAIVSGVTIKDHAKIHENAIVLAGNTPSTTDAGYYISNFAEICGYAKVSGSYATDSSVIRGAAIVNRAVIKGNTVIEGFARLIGPGIRIVDSKVYGSAEIMSEVNLYKSTIHCEARLFPFTRVNSSVISGDTALADITVTSNRRDTNGTLHEAIKVKTCTLEGVAVIDCAGQYLEDGMEAYKESVDHMAKVKARVDFAKEKDTAKTKEKAFDTSRLEEVETSYAGYEQDIVKLIKYPVMTDLTDSFTANFHSLLRKTRRSVEKENKAEYEGLIDALDDAFFAAESNARKIATSLFSDEDKAKVVDAGQMIAMALDEKASETEKKNAYKGAMRNLEGRVSLPEVTLSSLIERIGLKELKA